MRSCLLALLIVLGVTASAQCPTVATNQGYPKVTGIWLVDTRWNNDLAHFTDSVTVDVTGHSNLSLKAVIDPGGYPATEVNWDINATRPKVQFSRTDSDAPFTACGDVDVGGVPNIHRCFDLGPVGTYTVSATPRSGHCAVDEGTGLEVELTLSRDDPPVKRGDRKGSPADPYTERKTYCNEGRKPHRIICADGSCTYEETTDPLGDGVISMCVEECESFCTEDGNCKGIPGSCRRRGPQQSLSKQGLPAPPTQGDRHGWGVFANPAPHHQIAGAFHLEGGIRQGG